MSRFEDYAAKYANVECERRDGVIQAALHTQGGPWIFDEQSHHDLQLFFRDLAGDPENKVLILTGTGDRFCTGFDTASFLSRMSADPAQARLRTRRDGIHLLAALSEIDIPVITAVNGPALVHAEIALLGDVVLAADTMTLRDSMHFVMGNVPGDGVHIIWTQLLGPNRGRYFLMTGQTLNAHDAQRLGLVAEVLPRENLLKRAWELAQAWARLPGAVLTSSHRVINCERRRLIAANLHPGFTEQALAGALGPQYTGDMNMPPLEFLPREA